MGISLVGSVGAASQGASGAAVTPAWGTGSSRAAGNLLLLWVAVDGAGTLPAAPSGWSVAPQIATGTNGSASIFWAIASGGDAAPTVAAITSSVITAGLAEFSGAASASPLDKGGGTTGAASPTSVPATAADAATGNLIAVCVCGTTGTNVTIAYSDSLNNGATANATNNNAASTKHHYNFVYGVTTGNAAADSDSVSWTGTLGHGAYVIASFLASSSSTALAGTCAMSFGGGATYSNPLGGTGAMNFAGTGSVGTPISGIAALSFAGTATYSNPLGGTGAISLGGSATYGNPLGGSGALSFAGTATYGNPLAAVTTLALGGMATYANPLVAAAALVLGGSARYANPLAGAAALIMAGAAIPAGPLSGVTALLFGGSGRASVSTIPYLIAAALTSRTGSAGATARAGTSPVSSRDGAAALRVR